MRSQGHTSNDDSLGQYLREISRFPLLGRAEEARLAKGIRQGEEDALDKLVRSNLRFVVMVSKRYRNEGVPLSDLINEGNLGLMRAARKFDETKGTKFMSYAVWWIRQAILKALADQGHIVRIPLNRAGSVYRIGRRVSALAQELGREPGVMEIAETLDIAPAEVERAQAIASEHVSLDSPVTPGEDDRLVDRLPDRVSPEPDAEVMEKELAHVLDRALSTLGPREAVVLRSYYGLDGRAPKSLEEIGSGMGVTRERARQIKERALTRIRLDSWSGALATYASDR
ncbi:MAG: RNA polymerase sigma factor RpoD/SigA [Gemmatimonadetes bacterium]|nr:RNA polymerase sigma factor RpoD/SigA [Gemmatimonadota bacterium]